MRRLLVELPSLKLLWLLEGQQRLSCYVPRVCHQPAVRRRQHLVDANEDELKTTEVVATAVVVVAEEARPLHPLVKEPEEAGAVEQRLLTSSW